MYRNLFSVAGFTLLSRISGFFRDIALGAVLGAGLMADAFYVAFRLPNHFRAIFGEGAFNAAFVPGYSRSLTTQGAEAAKTFAGQILSLLLASQIVLLAVGWLFMPEIVRLLAPGFEADPEKFALTTTLTRITFPYLLCVTLVTLYSGALNANARFAAAAFAPVLLNLAMIACLAAAFVFPDASYAAAFGIAFAGVGELALVIFASRRAGILARPERPRWSADVKQFFTTLVPAVIGSAGVQIAIFADTIIASLLPTGGVSAIYYADRIYQLPIGVIGVAAGTVLLPEMSRRFAANEPGAAFHTQNRAMALTLALSAPFFVAFLTIAEPIIRAVFLRGRFTDEAAVAAGAVLAAYGFGLLAVVLIRSVVASFQARGDTKTPMYISLFAVAVNVLLKLALYKPLGAAGLALATAVGAWLNCGLLTFFAMRRGLMRPDVALGKTGIAVAVASFALALVGWFGLAPARGYAADIGVFEAEIGVALLMLAGLVVYAVVLIAALRALGVRLGRVQRQG